MQKDIQKRFELLFDKNANIACSMLKEFIYESEQSDIVYSYIDRMIDMLNEKSSYVRTRGLTLIAYNARWDSKNKINPFIDSYLEHILDEKPITSRQCIKLLPMIAQDKPELIEKITTKLNKADTSIYTDSMRSLVDKDIKEALDKISQINSTRG